MANTYIKLGEYNSSELPTRASGLLATQVLDKQITLTWVNNTDEAEYPSAVNVVQVWETDWQTTPEGDIPLSVSAQTIYNLDEGTNYRIRVCVRDANVLYPSQIIEPSTLTIPKPTITESGTTITTIGVDITGYDPTWQAIVMKINDGGGWVTVDTISATDTTFVYENLNPETQYLVLAASVVDTVEYDGVDIAVSTAAVVTPTLTESGATYTAVGVNIAGYNASWTALKMQYLNEDTGWQWVLAESITVTDTEYLYTGLTQGKDNYFRGVATVAGQDYNGEVVQINTPAAPVIPASNLYFESKIETEGAYYMSWDNNDPSVNSGVNQFWFDGVQKLWDVDWSLTEVQEAYWDWGLTFDHEYSVVVTTDPQDGRSAVDSDPLPVTIPFPATARVLAYDRWEGNNIIFTIDQYSGGWSDFDWRLYIEGVGAVAQISAGETEFTFDGTEYSGGGDRNVYCTAWYGDVDYVQSNTVVNDFVETFPTEIYWSFNGTLADVSGATNLVLQNGSEQYAAGLNGDQALNLSGNTKFMDDTFNYAQTLKYGDITTLSDCTIAYWFKPNWAETLSTIGWAFMTQATSGPEQFHFRDEFHQPADNYTVRTTGVYDQANIDVVSGWTDQTWSHYAIRRTYYGASPDEKEMVEVFIDGVKVASGETTTGTFSNIQDSIRLYIGGELVEGYIGGLMQYFHIYNEARSDAQILALYNNQE